MTIFKVSPGDMHEAEETYVVVPSLSIGLYPSLEAAGLHMYLLDKPEDWIIRRTDIMRQWCIGKHKAQRILNELKKVGLLRSTRYSDDDNLITGHQYDLFAYPDQIPISPEIGPVGKPTSPETGPQGEFIGVEGYSEGEIPISPVLQPLGNAAAGKQGHLHITDIYTEQIDTHDIGITHVAAEAAPVFENSDSALDEKSQEQNPPMQEYGLWDLRPFVKRHGMQAGDAKSWAIKKINEQNLRFDRDGDREAILEIVRESLQ